MQRKFLIFPALGLFLTFSWIVSFNLISEFYPIHVLDLNASTCDCERCIAKYEPGFSELFSNAPQPFLSPENNISRGIFKYWSGLQPGKASFERYEQIVMQAFEIFQPGPEMAGPSPDRCRKCAVVGNSGNLNSSHYGPLIDYHDIVIRINKAPTKGYEKDVGTKTTHRVMYPSSATHLNETVHLVFFPYKTHDLQWLVRSFTPRENDQNFEFLANKDRVMILSPAFIHHVHHVWLKKEGLYPSTGFLTLILSLHMCDEVNVFGFGADRRGNWDHYFETLRNKRLRTGNHPGDIEHKVLNRLQLQRKIRFFRGW